MTQAPDETPPDTTSAGQPANAARWRGSWRRLLDSVGTQAPRLQASLGALAVSGMLHGLAIACVLPVFHALLAAQDVSRALAWLLVMTVLAGAAAVCRWWAQGFDYDGHMAHASHLLRTRLGAHLRRMPMERLLDRRSGEIQASVLGSVDEHLSHVVTVADLILGATLPPLVVAVATLVYDWRLGLLLLALLPVLVALQAWRKPAFARNMRTLAQAHQQVNAEIMDYVQGLPVIRAARCAGPQAQALQASLVRLEQVQVEAHRRGARPTLLIASIVELGLFAATASGLLFVARGTLEPAVVLAVMVMAARFAGPLSDVVSYTAMIALMQAGLERVEALLNEPPLPQALPTGIPRSCEITFAAVTFRHARAGRPALQDVSFQLSERSMTAIVGPSGAGKTTLARLLMRHADPQQGHVSIGGVDLRRMPPGALDGLVSMVFQDVHLFDDTVEANIRFGTPGASPAQVEAAARAARCLDFVSALPQGWQTRLGDGGCRLSGGQRQRLSIARALLKDAPIVILDEPTAALDPDSEYEVQAAIDALVRQKTVIVIAHRLSTIVRADRILVIENGRLTESGTHAELQTAGGRYQAMWAAQQSAKVWRMSAPEAGSPHKA